MRLDSSPNPLSDFLNKVESSTVQPQSPYEILSGKEEPIAKSRRQLQAKQQEAQKQKIAKDIAEFNRPKKKTIQTKYGIFKVEVGGEWTPERYAQIRQEIEDDQEKNNASIDPKYANLPDIATETPVDVNAETLKNLRTFFKATMSPTGQIASSALEAGGKKLTEAGQKMMEDKGPLSNYIQPVGLVSTIAGGALEDASNPLATFASRTGNLFDPTATAEERAGAAGNIVVYALSAMPVAGAVGAGRTILKAGGTATEALTAATRSLLRDVVPAGKYIDNKITLKGVLDVIEADNQLAGLTRKELGKQLATAAKQSGQDAGAFYTRYLNKYTEGKGLLSSPPSLELPKTFAQFDITAPTQNADLVVDDALKSADNAIQGVTPTASVSVVDEANQAADDILRSASEPPLSAPMTAEQPPVPPTQTATTAIPEAPQEQFTSAKNAMTAEVRDEFNLEGFDEPTKRTWEEVFTKAKQNIVVNPNLVDELVIKVNNQIPLTDVEQSALVVGLSRAKQQARKLLKDKLNATTPEEIAMLTDQAKVAEQKVDQYTNALNQTGTETSRALNFRRAIIDAQEDLVSVRAQARQVYGKDLPKDVEDTINDVGTGLEDINKQIEEATGLGDTPADVAKANTQVKSIKKDLPKISPKKTKAKELENEKVIQKLKDAFNQIRRPKEPINTLGASVERTVKDPASVDYFTDLSKLQTDAGKVIRDIIKNDLIEDFDGLLNRMNELGIDVTDQDLKLILSGEYPTPTKLYDFNEIEKEYLKAVRRQLSKDAKDSPIAQRARIIKQIEKIGQNIATKTGIKEKPIQQIFAENLDMQNRLDDLQRQYAEMTEVPREKARLNREITKLKKEIENPVLAQKIEREVPAELKDLYIERNNLRNQKNQILTDLALQAEKENNPIAYKVMAGFNTLNELKFGADLDAANTHGLFFALHDPAWYRAAFDGLASFASEAKAKQFRARMMADPDYEEAVRSGLAGIKSRDLDAFVAHSSNLEKVPVLKIFYGAGNRFNEAFYAQLRLSLFKQYKQPLPFRDAKLFSDAELKQMSEAINNMTGRAEGIPGAILRGKELSKFNRVVFPTLNFYTSRWQLATATPLTRAIAQKNWHLVGKIAQSYAKFIGAAVLTGKLVEAKTGYKMSLDPINEPEKLFAFVDKDGNVVASPYKNIIQPLQLLLNTEVIRSAKVKAGLVSSEKDLEKKNIYETLTATTQPVINRIGVAPMAAYNLAMGIADKDYKSFGKSFDPTTREGAINLLMQFAPISASQAVENTQKSETIGEGIKSALIGKYTNPPFNKPKSESTIPAPPPVRQ